MKQLYDKLNYALLLMEVKQHMFNLETRRDGWNLRTSNSYNNYMPNTTEYLNRNKLTNAPPCARETPWMSLPVFFTLISQR